MPNNPYVESLIATLIAVGWKDRGCGGALARRTVADRVCRATAETDAGQPALRRDVQPVPADGLSVLLNAALIVAILGFFGVETTTFAALLAAGGVAIGVAWGGLLANFAAGAFLVFLRPFKVGDVGDHRRRQRDGRCGRPVQHHPATPPTTC